MNEEAVSQTLKGAEENVGLGLDSPLYRRVLAWMNERFPFANALLFFILYLSAASVARLPDAALIGYVDVVGCIVTWSFFLLLRIFDEHKDYEIDVQNHPQRILQSGLITLFHLRVMGGIAIALQLAWSLYRDGGLGYAAVSWGAMMFWTCLMGKEFFCGAWLEKRLTLYAFSHMLVMPLIILWLAKIANPQAAVDTNMIILMVLGFVGGFCFEITRKAKGAEEERATIDSYSKIFGVNGVSLIILLLTLIMLVLQIWLMQRIAGALPIIALLPSLLWLLCVWLVLSYRKRPTESARKKNEAIVALVMLSGYACIAGEAMFIAA